jgi:hypothetical protein
MKKLSKLELDIVVNEVVNNIKSIEENKSKELFEKSENKDLFLSKVNEMKELEDKLDLLNKEINILEKEFVKEGLRVFFISKNNRGYGNNKNKLFNVNLENGKGSSFSLYKDIEKEIILSSLEELNIRDLIKDLIEKFK